MFDLIKKYIHQAITFVIAVAVSVSFYFVYVEIQYRDTLNHIAKNTVISVKDAKDSLVSSQNAIKATERHVLDLQKKIDFLSKDEKTIALGPSLEPLGAIKEWQELTRAPE